MTDAQPAPTGPPPAPDAEQPPLLHTLGDLGGTLGQSEIPPASQLQQLVGAIVKVLAHAGVQVADELWPAEPEPVARPETAHAQAQQHTNTRLDRLEGMLERFFASETASEPAPSEPDPNQGNPPNSTEEPSS